MDKRKTPVPGTSALDAWAEARLAEMERASLRREILEVEPLAGMRVRRNGRELLNFSSNDYLGLAQHPQIKKVAAEAAEQYGAGAGASRHVTGTHPVYPELETELAAMKQAEAACVFGSGYLANIGVIPALAGKGDLVVMDKLCHACIYDGVKLSGAAVERYSHNSLDSLNNILKDSNNYNNCIIITETVFSMDGDRAPVKELLAMAERHNAWLMTDDAHGFGVVEPEARAHIQMGTLSKAVGSYGGYVCASRPVIEYIKNRARSLMFTTALPPAIVAGALASLTVMRADSERGRKALGNARRFTEMLGLPEAQSAIVPMILGSAEAALAASRKLEEGGFLVQAIRPPTVPANTARLRFTFSALHLDEDIESMIKYIKDNKLYLQSNVKNES